MLLRRAGLTASAGLSCTSNFSCCLCTSGQRMSVLCAGDETVHLAQVVEPSYK